MKLDDSLNIDARQDPQLKASDVLQLVFAGLPGSENVPQQANYEISRGGEPRWIVPENTPVALPVLRSWHPHNLKSRIQWSVILLACKSGSLSLLPGTARHIVNADSSYWRKWLPDYSDQWRAVIYVGNPSHTRKVVVFFVNQRGSVMAVAKVPLHSAATEAILNEASVLRRLGANHVVPQILFADDERGVAAQTWIEGRSVGRTFSEQHVELLSALANEGQSIRLSDVHGQISGWMAGLDLPLDETVVKRALDLLDDATQLPAFVEHRDFAPWNVRLLPDGKMTLIDWEWAVEKSLPWQDICHFFYIQDFLFKGPGKVGDSLAGNRLLRSYSRRFGIPSEVVRGLTMHYLLRTLCLVWANKEHERAKYLMEQVSALLDVQNPQF